MDKPRLREPLLSTIFAGLFVIVAMMVTFSPEWEFLRIILIFMGCSFTAAAIVTWPDYLAYRAGQRIHEIKAALVYDFTLACQAAKGLTMSQTDTVERQLGVSIYAIPGDGGPAEFIRCPGGDVPKYFAWDFFLEAVQLERGLLPPVREGNKIGGGDGWANGVRFATLLTNSIVANGWADDARGTHAAVLTEPLESVAARYGVEI